MNLNEDRNLLLAKKAVYAEQLFYYSKLCQTYQELAQYISRTREFSPYEIERRYSAPLAKIVASVNFEKTMQDLANEYDLTDTHVGKRYSDKELELFLQFAKSSNAFKTFQKASELLDEASEVDDSDRKKALNNFHKYMSNPRRPKAVNHFDELLHVHSPRYVGARFFLIANRSLQNINEVDDSHIPVNLSVLQQKITPESFGAVIKGYRLLEGRIDVLEKDSLAEDRFNIDNWDLSFNPEEKIEQAEAEFSYLNNSAKEKAYVVGSKVANASKRFYTSHKEALKRAVVLAVAVGSIVGGVNQISKEINAHGLDVNATKYEQTVTDETKNYLNDIMKQLNLERNSVDPQYTDLAEIEANLDLVLDAVIKDQVTTAFENYHKGYTVTGVESWFDKKYQGTSPNSEPSDYRFIDVSYIDDNGKPGKESIHKFSSDFFTQNSLNGIFDIEEDIDLNSPVWGAFHNSKNFLQRAKGIDDIMQYLEEQVESARHYSAFALKHGHTIFGSPYLKSVLPNKAQESNAPDKEDNER